MAVVNAGRTATDYRLVDAIASTMAAVYPSVFLVDVPAFNNTLVYGTTNLVTLDDVRHNLGLVSEPFAGSVAQSVLNEGDLIPVLIRKRRGIVAYLYLQQRKRGRAASGRQQH